MWNNNSSQDRVPRRSSREGDETASPEYAAAAALARRMVYPSHYDPQIPPGYYDDSMWSHHQRQAELMRLQRIQEQEAYAEEAARRNRLLELELSVNQMQEYERARLQMEMMRDMQHQEAISEASDRNRMLGVAGSYAGMDVRSHQIAEYLAGQRSRAVEEDAEAWRTSSHSGAAVAGREEIPVAASESELKTKKSPAAASASKKRKSDSVDGGVPAKKSAPDSPKKKAADSPKRKASPKKVKAMEKESNGSDNTAKANGGANAPALYPAPAAKSDSEPKSDAEKEPAKKEPVTTIAPVEKHASKTLAHLKTIQENHTKESSTPSKSNKRKKTPVKKMDSLATLPDKPSSAGGKAKKKATPAKPKPSPRAALVNSSSLKHNTGGPTVDDPVPPITEAQYENVEALMNEFCKVPFLAEFSRPVSLLHPELMSLYSKVVHHPMDLGHICRAIRRREYKNLRSIQLDMWRVFSNCVKFHTHPSNRDNAIPSFISIANHLRDFFNNLWQEFIMSSDAPPRKPGKGISPVHSAYQKRAEVRKERIVSISSTVLSPKCLRKIAEALEGFITSGGKIDNVDRDGVLGDVTAATGDVVTFIQSMRELIGVLEERIETRQDYTVAQFHADLRKTYTEDVFASEVLKRMRIGSRLDRLFWKILVPVHEINSRGVNQSSIWGNMAAVIWARESKKKPFWPAIVLGMMAPDFQKEDWHEALTNQNESRLPEKLREELLNGKRRAEQALKKQTTEPMSYFLVEFMGSHEFIWVRESDIVETFDPEVDPNVASAAGNVTKKRRSGHSSINPKTMSDAIEEGRWALEEFEILIGDPCGDNVDDDLESEAEELRLTYDVMCQSDDEADELEAADKRKANDSDVEELNELLVNNGVLDFSTEGRKAAKARAAEMKKQKAALAKQEKNVKAKKDAAAKKPNRPGVTEDDTKELARLLEEDEKRAEARRKKRSRDHEKSLKDLEKQSKKSKGTPDKRHSNFIPEKKARAESFVKSFLIHKHNAHTDFRGAPFIPTNSVDPSGLLGMALAFRAAAGDIPFYDHKGREYIPNPWDAIDSTTPKESIVRCQRLQEQIALVETQLQKVKADTARRVSLCDVAKQSRDATYQKFIDAGNEIKSSKKVFVSNSSKKKKKVIDKLDPVESSAVATDPVDSSAVAIDHVGGSAAAPHEEKHAQPAVDANSMAISNGHANESSSEPPTVTSGAHMQTNHVDQESFDAKPKTEANTAIAATTMEE